MESTGHVFVPEAGEPGTSEACTENLTVLRPSVVDNWPVMVPVMAAELEVIAAFLSELLDTILPRKKE